MLLTVVGCMQTGGGIVIVSGVGLEVTASSALHGNTAGRAGAAVWARQATLAFSHASIVGNVVSNMDHESRFPLEVVGGGGIFAERSELALEDTQLSSNSVDAGPCEDPTSIESNHGQGCERAVVAGGTINHMDGYNESDNCEWRVQCPGGADTVRLNVTTYNLNNRVGGVGNLMMTVELLEDAGNLVWSTVANSTAQSVEEPGTALTLTFRSPISNMVYTELRAGGMRAEARCCKNGRGGGLYSLGGNVTLQRATLDGNTASTSSDLLPNGQAMYLERLTRFFVNDTTFGGADPTAAVALIGAPAADCLALRPCANGTQCSYLDYSLSCSACATNQISDGLFCSSCPAGEQPARNLSRCEACPPARAGVDGVCTECGVPGSALQDLVVSAGGTQCRACTVYEGKDVTCFQSDYTEVGGGGLCRPCQELSCVQR